MNSNFSPINNSKQINSNNFFSNSVSKTIINSFNFSQDNQIKQNIFSKKNENLNKNINPKNLLKLSSNNNNTLPQEKKLLNSPKKNLEFSSENNFTLKPNYLSLLSIYYSIKNIDKIYKSFEENIINNQNFTIDPENYIIISKTKEASEIMKTSQFWIVYLEYLFKLNKIKTRDHFLRLIKEAFKFENNDNEILKKYYLEKIQIFFPLQENNSNVIDKNKYISLLDNNSKRIFYEKKFGPKRIQNEKKKFNNTLEGMNKISKINFDKINNIKKKEKEKLLGNIKGTILEETRDTVDDSFIFSMKKDYTLKTPVKNQKNDFSYEEIYPNDLVEGSILKFNQSFISQNSDISK